MGRKGTGARRLAAALLPLLLLALPSVAAAQEGYCVGDLNPPTPRTGAPPLVMGIYPGGVAGQLGPPKPAVPEVAFKRQAALDLLRGDREFAVHLYVKFTGDGSSDANNARIGRELDEYMRRGYVGELVVTYRPTARRGAPDVAEFTKYVREVVRRFGPDPKFHSIQVTNEVTNSISPDASDGAFPGARDATIQGVIAAKDEARKGGFEHLEVGFNWLYRLDPNTDREFWTYLRDKGGKPFVDALDWVGVDAYPGTFFPPANRPGGERNALVNAFSVLRDCYMKIPGIPNSVPIHVSENGYPTSPARSYAEQEAVLRAMVSTVSEFRANYNVTDYRWFDLRDGDSSDPDFGQQYGIMRDDYTPKPAFGAYRQLVAALGARRGAAGGSPARRCLARRVQVGRRGIGRARLMVRRPTLRRRLGNPGAFSARSDRWCVRGGGTVRVAYDSRARARVVASTARGHRVGRAGRGTRTRGLPRARRLARGLLRARPGGRALVGVRKGRVRYVAVADRSTLRNRRALRALLRRAGL
jgi:hypothetical protein